jgi:hypothetical protein
MVGRISMDLANTMFVGDDVDREPFVYFLGSFELLDYLLMDFEA